MVATDHVPLVVLELSEAMLAAEEFEARIAAVSTVVADSMSQWMAHGEEDWSAVVDGHAL
jgi:hypothetical protein